MARRSSRRQPATDSPARVKRPVSSGTDTEHPDEIRDHIRYTSGPSMWTQAFFERQSRAEPLPAPTGDPRPWRIAGRMLALIAIGAWGYAWVAAPTADQSTALVGIGWVLLVLAIVALGRAWFLSD